MAKLAVKTEAAPNLDKINYLNIVLMLVSLALAFLLPFELFLLSYAILGPLHYLTEISWLKDRHYFLKSRMEIWFFLLVAALLLIANFYSQSEISIYYSGIFPGLIFAAFIFALSALFWKSSVVKIYVFVMALVFGLMLNQMYRDDFYLVFAVLLPTLVHVYFFTGTFILYGALKSRSASALISLMIFLICPLICVLVPVVLAGEPSAFAAENTNIYWSINQALAHYLNFGQVKQAFELFNNPAAIALMRVIAFAYTYHYLNWFSKAEVIKWQKISRRRWAVIIACWLASVALYMWNYQLGFIVLFLLSMLHVFLEFPLNWITMVGIGQETGRLFTARTISSQSSKSKN